MIRKDNGKIFRSQAEIIQQWTKYCSNLYTQNGTGDIMVRELLQITINNSKELQDILYSEVEKTERTL